MNLGLDLGLSASGPLSAEAHPNFVEFDGSAGHYLTASIALTTTTLWEQRASIEPADWTPTVSQRPFDGRAGYILLASGGTASYVWRDASTFRTVDVSSVISGLEGRQDLRFRVDSDANLLSVWTREPGQALSDDLGWGTSSDFGASSSAARVAGTSDHRINSLNNPYAGKVYAVLALDIDNSATDYEFDGTATVDWVMTGP